MKHKKFLVTFSIIFLIISACAGNDVNDLPTAEFNPQIQSNVPQTEDDVPRISLEEAKVAIDSGAAILVDVRNTQSYEKLHAKGALSIPLEIFEENINNVPLEKTDWIITYCT